MVGDNGVGLSALTLVLPSTTLTEGESIGSVYFEIVLDLKLETYFVW
jgi:hypothetical protein